jgi:hypothetical protein
VECVGPTPKGKLSCNVQRGFGFHKAVAVRYEGEGIWVVRIDAELLSKRTSLRRLNSDEAEIVAAIPLADETTAARAEDAYPVEQDQTVRRVHAAGIIGIDNDWLACLHGTYLLANTAPARLRWPGCALIFLASYGDVDIWMRVCAHLREL